MKSSAQRPDPWVGRDVYVDDPEKTTPAGQGSSKMALVIKAAVVPAPKPSLVVKLPVTTGGASSISGKKPLISVSIPAKPKGQPAVPIKSKECFPESKILIDPSSIKTLEQCAAVGQIMGITESPNALYIISSFLLERLSGPSDDKTLSWVESGFYNFSMRISRQAASAVIKAQRPASTVKEWQADLPTMCTTPTDEEKKVLLLLGDSVRHIRQETKWVQVRSHEALVLNTPKSIPETPIPTAVNEQGPVLGSSGSGNTTTRPSVTATKNTGPYQAKPGVAQATKTSALGVTNASGSVAKFPAPGGTKRSINAFDEPFFFKSQRRKVEQELSSKSLKK